MTEKSVFYNEEIKKRFINTLETEAIKTFSEFPLSKALRTEDFYSKDLYDMTLDQIGEVASDLSCATLDAVYNNILKIDEYITWAIDNGYRSSNINPLKTINKRDWSKQFISSYRTYLFKREDIVEMMKDLVNEVDQAVLLALFEGVEGKGFSELLNLKITDIKTEGKQPMLNLKDDAQEKPRTIPVSELLVTKLKETNDQKEYINKNGLTTNQRYATSKIEQSEFIFNKTTRGKQGGRPDSFFVSRKFTEFKDIFGHEHLVAKHIKDSGINHMANELQVDGILSKDSMRMIAEQFNTSYTTAGEVRYRNLTKIKQVIDVAEFEEVYGYKMKF